MKRLIALAVILLVASSCFVVLMKASSVQAANQPSAVGIVVYPAKVDIDPLSFFRISIVAENVSNLYAMQFNLFYSSTAMVITRITGGLVLAKWNSHFGDATINRYYNQTHGMMQGSWSFIRNSSGLSGNVVLATMNCASLSPSDSELVLSDTLLLDNKLSEIPHTPYPGHLIVGAIYPDVAVLSVTPLKSFVIKGHTLGIDVQVRNMLPAHILPQNVTFNLSIYYNLTSTPKAPGTLIETKTVPDLKPLETRTVPFNWNISMNFTSDEYTILAFATPLPNELNIENNKATSDVILVPIPGDISGPNGLPDGVVNIYDVVDVVRHYPAVYPNPKYDADCDMNFDGKIDVKDLAIIASLVK